MRDDGTQPAAERRGPRHAAPRKSLLTRLQAPAGKAIALAAMPTAVLVGLGMTPRLALADEQDIPYAPGPCVTRSDEPQESGSPSEAPGPSEIPSASGSPTGPEPPEPPAGGSGPPGTGDGGGSDEEGGKDGGKEPAPGASPSASGAAEEAARPGTGTAPAPPPGAPPAPTGSGNPLDPLGLGDAIRDILDGPDDGPAATPPASAPAGPPASGRPSVPPAEPPATGPSAGPPAVRPEPEPAGDGERDRIEEAIREAADKAGVRVEELPEDVKGLDPREDEDIPEGAKPRFPCPTHDPQALADAKAEPGIPLLPDDPWRLESSLLTLRGLDYHGIVEVRTGSGATKKVLKFTATSVDIKDLHQTTVHSEGRTAHVTSRPGSTSTIRGGTVTMYTEQLKGNLFGIVPITFSPRTPPPVDVPFAFFTRVEVVQAGQFGGNLTVPGLRNRIEG